MKKKLFALFLLCSLSLCMFGQTEKFTAPVKWENYKVSEREVSILLPKLPNLIYGADVCAEVENNKYAVYADGIVFGFNITSKTKQEIPRFCTQKKRFNQKNFEERVKEIKSLLETEVEAKASLNNFEAIKIVGSSVSQTYWLINDFANKRWFELWVAEATPTNPAVKNFIESIKIGKNPIGIEIGNGSDRTLGDEAISEKNDSDSAGENLPPNADAVIIPLNFIIKPRANYTDAARQNQIQGTVSTRVTFLGSGGIGSVSPTTSLPFGLTEQAIAAAKKIVFIPAKRNGKNYSVVKTVQYSFSIY